jgi:monoterpene epsilon-lactone hydrolase
MKLPVSTLIDCGLAILALPLLAFAQEAYPQLKVPAREVPVPSTVSPEMQKLIATPVPPPTPMPTTAQGWKELQQEANADEEKTARALAELLGSKVEATEVAGVKCYRVTPKVVAPRKENDLIVHVHGGAFVFNAGLAGTLEAILLADACKTRVLSIDYRVPPDHPFPAAPDDMFSVWKAVLKDYDPKNVVMGGTSSGGGLIMTTMLRCKADQLAMPAAIFLGTPGAYLPKSGDSLYLSAEVDHVLGRYEGLLEECIKLYAGGRDWKDPLLSPIYGDFSGWPPAILISGTRDLLLSPTIRTHRKLRAAGVPAELHVYEGMSHADYLSAFPTLEARDALAEIASFFDRYLNR